MYISDIKDAKESGEVLYFHETSNSKIDVKIEDYHTYLSGFRVYWRKASRGSGWDNYFEFDGISTNLLSKKVISKGKAKFCGKQCEVVTLPDSLNEIKHPKFGTFVFTSKTPDEYIKKNNQDISDFFSESMDKEINKFIEDNIVKKFVELDKIVTEYELPTEERQRLGVIILQKIEPQIKSLCEDVPGIKGFLSMFKAKKQ